jgi:Sema domain
MFRNRYYQYLFFTIFRTLHLDEARNALYIGAMDRVLRVNLANVSATSCETDSLLLEAANTAACVAKGKSEAYDCRNHIRVIQPIGNGERLYVCGTNAHNPQVR